MISGRKVKPNKFLLEEIQFEEQYFTSRSDKIKDDPILEFPKPENNRIDINHWNNKDKYYDPRSLNPCQKKRSNITKITL